jgi:hypothetical protein
MSGIQLRALLALASMCCSFMLTAGAVKGERTFLVQVKSAAPVDEKTSLYVVDPKDRAAIGKIRKTNLAAALVATVDASGELKGSDKNGRPIIAIAEKDLKALQDSPAIRSVPVKAAKDWTPVNRLRLSYSGASIGEKEAKELGLKIVEDYAKGSFLIVEPLDGKVNADLLKKLEKQPRIENVTPMFKVKAIRTPNRKGS